MLIDTLKDTIQDCNINFLIGSGLSRPLLTTLGRIELLLTDLAGRADVPAERSTLVRASLYKAYFDGVIYPNLKILASAPETTAVSKNYETLLSSINTVLLRRKTTIIGKSVNVFTTNIDVFLDNALEELGLEFNDGFTGRFHPRFSLSNFKKTHFIKSSHYDNTSELPVFNLLKLHGSLSWTLGDADVEFSSDLTHVKTVAEALVSSGCLLDVPDDATVDSLLAAAQGKSPDASVDAFLKAYEQLLIVVNPTKDKFKHTLLNQTYYELLRLYSNELEKENTALFVLGFSFADEHIREITLRSANSNPTLVIYVVAYDSDARITLDGLLSSRAVNRNIKIISPDLTEEGTDSHVYDFDGINQRVILPLLQSIDSARLAAPSTPGVTPNAQS